MAANNQGAFMKALATLTTTLAILALLGGCAELKDAGRTVGDTTKDVTREIGHTTRDATKAIGHATRDATKAVGHASRDAVNSVKEELSEEKN
jgi:Sec-independent protein translocase protein TatA